MIFAFDYGEDVGQGVISRFKANFIACLSLQIENKVPDEDTKSEELKLQCINHFNL